MAARNVVTIETSIKLALYENKSQIHELKLQRKIKWNGLQYASVSTNVS